MVWFSTQRRASSGCVTQPGLESLSAQMETARGLGRRLRWLYFSMVHKLPRQIAALLLPSRNNVPILSQVLLTFLFTQTSSLLYLDEFRQPGNCGFIGARTQGQQQPITFTNSASLQLLKPHSPGASELPGKLKKRSKKQDSMKSMNPTSRVVSQCYLLNTPKATWSERHLSVELTALPTAAAPVCRARFHCLCSCATQTGQPGQKTAWC